jgi:hypothetical protein
MIALERLVSDLVLAMHKDERVKLFEGFPYPIFNENRIKHMQWYPLPIRFHKDNLVIV